jgi:hypothetical protein
MEENDSKKKLNPIALVIVLLLIVIVVAGAVFGMKYLDMQEQLANSQQPSTGIKQEGNVFFDDESADNFASERVSGIAIEMYSVIDFKRTSDGKLVGDPGIVNTNDFQYLVRIMLSDTSEVVYESGLVPPDAKISKIELTKDLEPGVYDANASFFAISAKDNQTDIGSTGLAIKLRVS